MSIQEKLHTLNATLFILPAVLFSRNSHLHIMRWQEFRIVSWRAKINMIEFANSILFSSCQTVLFSLPKFAASNLERVTTSLDKKFAQVFGVETTNAFQLAECVVLLSRMRKKQQYLTSHFTTYVTITFCSCLLHCLITFWPLKKGSSSIVKSHTYLYIVSFCHNTRRQYHIQICAPAVYRINANVKFFFSDQTRV